MDNALNVPGSVNRASSFGNASAFTISRRNLIQAAGAAIVLAGCGVRDSVEPEKPPATVTSLTATSPFYIAHRGGGDNWPEMTAYAYEESAQLPWVTALEISAVRSADGILVCSHDATTLRLTGVNFSIPQQTWESLSKLRIKATWTQDPTQPSRPYATFNEVVEKYIDRFVLFVEPKDPTAIQPLMKKMISLGNPERVVWKQPINQGNFHAAKAAGFTTWGYVLNEAGHIGANLPRFAASPDIDYLGAPTYENDSFISQISRAAKDNGKKTIMWPIRRVEDRTRGMELGCSGMMTSNIAEVPKIPV